MHHKVIIIAEAGVNHNGDLGIARMLIERAAEAGADFVKFQSFSAEKLVSEKAAKAAYQVSNTAGGDDFQFQMLKSLELTREMHYLLKEHCALCGISFLSTPFDEDAADMLVELSIPFFKIPSGELTNKPFLQYLASKGLPVVLSTGMADLKEVQDSIRVLTGAGTLQEHITVLHCNTEYPTAMEDVNLRAMVTMRDILGVNVGYSDHTNGIEVAVAAVALGATLIEKHFTLDRSMPGPDHKASLEPDELKKMVSSIRNIEKAMGNGTKTPTESEIKNIPVARRSIHLARQMRKGELISAEDLLMIRPGDGISPMEIEQITGSIVRRDLPAKHKLSWEDIAS